MAYRERRRRVDVASLKEALRRMYHELVKGRSRVRFSTPRSSFDDPSSLEPPIFLLGPYGSGTTLMRYVIDSHRRICCPPESDFIEAFEPLLTNPRYRQGLDAMGFDTDHVEQQIRQVCTYFFGNYARSWNKARWADKTPAYVDHAEFLRRLFPQAQFVLVHRHALDQAHSYTRGGTFPRQPLEPFQQRPDDDLRITCCRYWLDKTQRLLDFEARHPRQCHRLRYEDVCRSPEEQLRPLMEFLGEDWDDAVLEFYKQRHDKGNEHGRVVATRGFELSAENYRQWPETIRTRCFEIAAPGLIALGYDVE